MMPTHHKFRECTKEELSRFVAEYPRALKVNVTEICDPPLKTYNDFSDGNVWPESVVAKVVMNSVRAREPDSHYLLTVTR